MNLSRFVDRDVATVKCLSCGSIFKLSGLRKDEPYRLANPAGGSLAITYYHCRCGKILVYEPPDEGDLVLLEGVEFLDS